MRRQPIRSFCPPKGKPMKMFAPLTMHLASRTQDSHREHGRMRVGVAFFGGGGELPEFVIANANEKLLVTSGCLWLRFWDSALVSRLHIRLQTEEKTLSFRFEIVTHC